MHSNFQFHVISRIDIVHLLSIYSVGGRRLNKASTHGLVLLMLNLFLFTGSSTVALTLLYFDAT